MMESLKLEFSSKLYNILLKNKNNNEEVNQDKSLGDEMDDDLPHECCFCAELFFDGHKFNFHDCRKLKEHLCTYESCKKSFKKSSELRKHEVRVQLLIPSPLLYWIIFKRIHLNIRNFKCTECSKDFVHQTSLKNHLLTHSNIKSFVCSVCGLSFTTNGNLNQHKMTHEGENQKKFSCEICSKKFNRSTNLKEHIATHTKEQRYHCSTCEKKFSNSSALSKHKKLHNDVKPFQCPNTTCKKRFSQRSHLKKHVNSSVHSESKSCYPGSLPKAEKLSKPVIISNEVIVEASRLD